MPAQKGGHAAIVRMHEKHSASSSQSGPASGHSSSSYRVAAASLLILLTAEPYPFAGPMLSPDSSLAGTSTVMLPAV